MASIWSYNEIRCRCWAQLSHMTHELAIPKPYCSQTGSSLSHFHFHLWHLVDLEWQETCDKTLVAFLLFLATQSHMSATTSNCKDLDLDAHAFVEWVEWKRDTTYFLYYCHTHRAALFLSHTGLLNSSLTLCHKRFVMTYLIWIRKYLSFHLSQSYVSYSSRNA